MSDLIVSANGPNLRPPHNSRKKPASKDASEAQASKALEKRPIFLALQGGGARGIVHVGALSAINDLQLEIKGVAGTSAGSIVAALIAAGYSGNDLLDEDLSNPTHLFDRLSSDQSPSDTAATKPTAKKPTDLFSKAGWRWMRLIRRLSKPQHPAFTLTLAVSLIGAYAYLSFVLMTVHVLLGLAANLAAVGALVWGGFKLTKGLTTLNRVRNFVDRAIRHKLGTALEQNHDGSQLPLTFADLKRARGIPLKIIATNTSSESVEVFCAYKTPNVSIADAVAASVCLPIIFKPWAIKFSRRNEKNEPDTHQFLDGGFVSNLPAWPFDEERLLHPEVPTIAMSIATPGARSKHWMSSIINTIVNGTAEIDTRAVGRFTKIPLSTDWGMLDFDKSFNEVYIQALKAKQTTVKQLSNELIETPRVLRTAAQAILEDVSQAMSLYWGVLHSEIDLGGKIRVAIASPRSSSPGLMSLVSTSGYSRDLGYGAVLPTAHPGMAAWKDRQPLLKRVDAGAIAFRPHLDDAQWILCVPLRPQEATNESPLKPCVVLIEFAIAFDLSIHSSHDHLSDMATCLAGIVNDYNESKGIATFVQGANACI
ncbi:patatin-like phospholipase family protein [Pseudomonas sp. 21LCFQ010]|uniref:patatin-like phospholipase family protein n=1 Tax=Pseudomonas sp. 21LCFQ010 TaxID=2957506 RepID=UPI0020974698|nr:patatin-like phospholipase family protein [Pseudomonas sp. 21LCFQ010]MCO8161111.1 patatin-like phospholipase family protein [Pseudomonas sp. 21LCFQ010]